MDSHMIWRPETVPREKRDTTVTVEELQLDDCDSITGSTSPRKRKNEEEEQCFTMTPKINPPTDNNEERLSPKRQRQRGNQVHTNRKERRVTFAEPESDTPDKSRLVSTPAKANAAVHRYLTLNPKSASLDSGYISSASDSRSESSKSHDSIDEGSYDISSLSVLNTKTFEFDNIMNELDMMHPLSDEAPTNRLESTTRMKEMESAEFKKTARTIQRFYPELAIWLSIHRIQMYPIIEQTHQLIVAIKGGEELMKGDLTPEAAKRLEKMIEKLMEAQAMVSPALACALSNALEAKKRAESSDKKEQSPQAHGSESHVENDYTDEYLSSVIPMWANILNSLGTEDCVTHMEVFRCNQYNFTSQEAQLINSAECLHMRYKRWYAWLFKDRDDEPTEKERRGANYEAEKAREGFTALQAEVKACYGIIE